MRRSGMILVAALVAIGFSSQAQASDPSAAAKKPPPPKCSVNNGGCSSDATCSDKGKGVTCTCKTGFTGNGITCTDINECATGNGGCSVNATCTNTVGSRTCACNAGYTGTGLSCTDINECLTNNGGCSANATCTNTPGARTCACNSGYAGDGITCTPTAADTQAPVFLSITGIPSSADVTNGSFPFTVGLEGTDNQSGIHLMTVALRTPGNTFAVGCDVPPSGSPPQTNVQGSCNVTIPQYSEPGTYTLWANISDNMGNFTAYEGATELAGIANRATIDVTGPPDVTWPDIDFITGNPEIIDVTGGPVIVTLNAAAHELTNTTASGIREIRMEWQHSVTGFLVGDCVFFAPLDPVNFQPTYPLTLTGSCQIVFPTDTPAGQYNLIATVTDRVFNVHSYMVGQLSGIANRTDTTVISTTPPF